MTPIVGAGTVELNLLREDGRVAVLTLTNVCYTPEVTCNVLSPGQLRRERQVLVQPQLNHATTLRCPNGVDMGHVVEHGKLWHLVPSPDYHDTDNEIWYPCTHAKVKAINCKWYTTDDTKIRPHAEAHFVRNFLPCPLQDNRSCNSGYPPDDLEALLKGHREGSYECPRALDRVCNENFSSEILLLVHLDKTHAPWPLRQGHKVSFGL